MLDKIFLECWCVTAAFIALADDPRPFLVKVDQGLCDVLALVRIASQQVRCAASPKNRYELPAQIEAVPHRDIHSLAGLRAVGVAGVSGNEDPRMALIHIVALKVVEPVGQALTDFIDRPPDGLLNLEGIGMEDRLCRPDEIGGIDIPAARALALGKSFHLDVDTGQIAAFARNDQKRAATTRLDQRLLPYVGEIRHGENVHHAPGLVRRVPLEFKADFPAHRAAGAVAPDNISGAHCRG